MCFSSLGLKSEKVCVWRSITPGYNNSSTTKLKNVKPAHLWSNWTDCNGCAENLIVKRMAELTGSSLESVGSDVVGSLVARVVRFASSPDEFKTGVHHTPKLTHVSYRKIEERQNEVVLGMSTQGTLARPNAEDVLRRVAVVVHNHILKCEARKKLLTPATSDAGMFHTTKMLAFSEENFVTPQLEYHFVRVPLCRLGFHFVIREVKKQYLMPSLEEVHQFISDLFVKAQLSAECSIVCLIYVERLMELANVPLVKTTWRPCLLCGLLLASKVWQDLPSWNSEIAQIYPQFSLPSINRLGTSVIPSFRLLPSAHFVFCARCAAILFVNHFLAKSFLISTPHAELNTRHSTESLFCREIKWDLYISASAYAKYYFALHSLNEKKDFRMKYNAMLLNAPNAQQVASRSTGIKQLYSRSLPDKS